MRDRRFDSMHLKGKNRSLVSTAIVRRDLASNMRSVKLGVWVGRVTVSAPSATEHHVTTRHRTLVHLP